MALFNDSIVISRTPEEVYDFVTNAGDWPKWHRNSEGVEGDIKSPMKLNDVVREKGRVPFKSGFIEWKCTQWNYPNEFRIDGQGMGGKGFVHYKLEPCNEGTKFTRTLEFGFYEGFMKYLQKLIVPVVRRNQTQSVEELKEAVEKYVKPSK